METNGIITCCGCLNNGRRMVKINDINIRNCFLEIINEKQICIESMDCKVLQVCYECTAMLLKFSRFKKQVVSSYKTFQNYLEQDPWCHDKTVAHIRLHRSQTFYTSVGVQKDFEAPMVDVKLEVTKDDMSDSALNDDTSSRHDDVEPAFEISKKRKKKVKKKRIVNEKIKTETEAEFYEVQLKEADIEEDRRMLALNEDYLNALFKCEMCIVSFPNEDDLKDHINIKHDLYSSKYKCSICTCSFGSEVSYNYHRRKHLRRLQCAACPQRFPGKLAASQHYRQAHYLGKGIKYEFDERILEKCDQKTNGQSEVRDSEWLSVDVPDCEGKLSHPCEVCGKKFKWKTSLAKHLEKHQIEAGQKRKPYCAICRLTFTTTPNLKKHVRTSSKHKMHLKLRKLNENTESCDTSKQKSQMEEIKSSVSSSQTKFACSQCERTFLWRGNLLRHLQSHAAKAKGELVCQPCNRSFSSIATYQQHMNSSKKHVTEDNFKYMCSDCAKRFPTKSHLRDHINWDHLKNYVYNCDECQKSFRTSNSVYHHKKAAHSKDGFDRLCDHCGKAFPTNAKLRSHILGLHSGPGSHQCGFCDAKFSWHSCLSRHVRRKHRKDNKIS